MMQMQKKEPLRRNGVKTAKASAKKRKPQRSQKELLIAARSDVKALKAQVALLKKDSLKLERIRKLLKK